MLYKKASEMKPTPIPVSYTHLDVYKRQPQSWAGQPQEVIEQKSGIPGISFCHASRFIITAKDKDCLLYTSL